jgi:hypothetical protein
MTPIGDQRYQCSLANPGPATPDGSGGYTQAWIPLAPARAYFAITPAQAVERSVAGTVEASARWHVVGAMHAGINQYTRLEVLEGMYRGRSFDVQSATPVTGDRGELPYRLALDCSEVLA